MKRQHLAKIMWGDTCDEQNRAGNQRWFKLIFFLIVAISWYPEGGKGRYPTAH